MTDAAIEPPCEQNVAYLSESIELVTKGMQHALYISSKINTTKSKNGGPPFARRAILGCQGKAFAVVANHRGALSLQAASKVEVPPDFSQQRKSVVVEESLLSTLKRAAPPRPSHTSSCTTSCRHHDLPLKTMKYAMVGRYRTLLTTNHHHVACHALATELDTWFRIVDQDMADARLKALRSNDTEGYVQHLSQLKFRSVLHIMELTHHFMLRLGARLESATTSNNATASAAAPSKGGTTQQQAHQGSASSRHQIIGGSGGGGGGDEDPDVARFRLYVASTKDEYRLVHRSNAIVAKQPESLRATLMPHQMDGLRFLASLRANNINGILADEMGVGKTLQTLAFFLHLKEEQQQQNQAGGVPPPPYGPSLVLAPLSIVREWSEAAANFCPTLRTRVFDADDADSRDWVTLASQADVVLLALHRVKQFGWMLAQIPWNYVVVDEAHKAVSNPDTITAKSIRDVRCKFRLVLTGTPLNSDIKELWALLNFLNPGVFDERDSFDNVFRRPFGLTSGGTASNSGDDVFGEEERALLVMRMHQILRPFMLRRTKTDVDKGLKITFHTITCPMTAVQTWLIDLVRSRGLVPAVLEGGGGVDNDEALPSKQGKKKDDKDDNGGGDVGLRAVTTKESTIQGICNHPFMIPFFTQVMHRLSRVPPRPGSTSAAGTVAEAITQITTAAPAATTFHGHSDDHGQEAPAGAADVLPTTQQEPTTKEQAATAPHKPTANNALAQALIASSGKFAVLQYIFDVLHQNGEKVVVFSHWLDTLDLLKEYLEASQQGNAFVCLTGADDADERRRCVERFRADPEVFIFLVSMKAGGCGLNLQVASKVILIDRDYTVTNEDQAIARVFRIGQGRTVRAIYLTTDDPAERRIVDIATRKNRARVAIVETGAFQVKRDGVAKPAAGIQTGAAFEQDPEGLIDVEEDENEGASRGAAADPIIDGATGSTAAEKTTNTPPLPPTPQPLR